MVESGCRDMGMAMTAVSANAERFQHDWAAFYPTCPPLGWLLRNREGIPWVRFHALPASKRYPEDEAERGIILSRANSLGDRLLGPCQLCWVVEADCSEASTQEEVSMTASESDDPEDPIWNFHARPEPWRAGAFDAELLSIANNGPRRTIWMRCDDGSVFAPYDGGFDLFPASWMEVAKLKLEWPEWLSTHPQGL